MIELYYKKYFGHTYGIYSILREEYIRPIWDDGKTMILEDNTEEHILIGINIEKLIL